jgi:hypothetical protein
MKISTRASVLWVLLIGILAIFQIVTSVLSRRHVQFFQSRREMLVVTALGIVTLAGIIVKGSKNRS